MSDANSLAATYRSRLASFSADARQILGAVEGSSSRIVTLEESYAKLGKLSLQQDDLVRQALRCVEHGLYRAAHVMAWAAFMDFLEEKLESDGLTAVRAARPKWTHKSMEDMREYVAEYQLIEVTQAVGLCTKNQKKALHGLLNKRNECAHPSSYAPSLNEALGYISEVLARLRTLQAKTL